MKTNICHSMMTAFPTNDSPIKNFQHASVNVNDHYSLPDQLRCSKDQMPFMTRVELDVEQNAGVHIFKAEAGELFRTKCNG